MSAAAPTPDPIDEPSEAGRNRALVERQLARLDRLAEIGLEMAEALGAQAKGTGPEVTGGDVALAYARVARGVRMATLLQTRLVEGPPASGRAGRAPAGGGDDDDEDDGRIQIRWLNEVESDGYDRCEAPECAETVEAVERLDDSWIDGPASSPVYGEGGPEGRRGRSAAAILETADLEDASAAQPAQPLKPFGTASPLAGKHAPGLQTGLSYSPSQ
jgi:hypothetical protein